MKAKRLDFRLILAPFHELLCKRDTKFQCSGNFPFKAIQYKKYLVVIQKKIFHPSTSVLFAAKNKTSCSGYKQNQAMENIIIKCQKNKFEDSKLRKWASSICKFHTVFPIHRRNNILNQSKLQVD